MTRYGPRTRAQPSLRSFRPAVVRLAALLLCLSAFPLPGASQVYTVQGGSSSLFHAHGGSVIVRTPEYEAGFSSGVMDGLRLGGYLRTEFRGYSLTAGDEAVSIRLPTDMFNPSHYFLVRGLGVGKQYEHHSVYGFLGATSTGFSTPFFRSGTTDTAAAAFFWDSQLSPTVRLFSRSVFSDRQTTINGLEWLPRPNLRAAVAGGLGANQGYFASSVSAEKSWVSVLASYIRAGDGFRRVLVRAPTNAENDRENIQVVLKPKPYLALRLSRQNFLSPLSDAPAGLRGTMNEFGFSATTREFLLGGRFYDSQVTGNRTQGMSLSVGRGIAGRLQANANWLLSRSAGGSTFSSVVMAVREIVSPRLTLLQLITHSEGHTSVAFGGQFLSNRLTLSVDYQTIYNPFLAPRPFRQALSLNLRLHLFGSLQMNAGTYLAPDGRVRYIAHASTFLYQGVFGTEASPAITLHKYLIHGRVTDEEGRPIRGAALQIDGEMAFTDSTGEFFVRKRKTGPYRLEVVVSEFLQPGFFEVLSAPETVTAARDDEATPVLIVLRRVRKPAP